MYPILGRAQNWIPFRRPILGARLGPQRNGWFVCVCCVVGWLVRVCCAVSACWLVTACCVAVDSQCVAWLLGWFEFLALLLCWLVRLCCVVGWLIRVCCVVGWCGSSLFRALLVVSNLLRGRLLGSSMYRGAVLLLVWCKFATHRNKRNLVGSFHADSGTMYKEKGCEE